VRAFFLFSEYSDDVIDDWAETNINSEGTGCSTEAVTWLEADAEGNKTGSLSV